MRESSLTPEYRDYLLSLCDKALEHVCDSIDGVSDNLVCAAPHYLRCNSYNLYGFLGRAITTNNNEKNITPTNNKVSTTRNTDNIKPNTTTSYVRQLRIDFFLNGYQKIKHKAAINYNQVEDYRNTFLQPGMNIPTSMLDYIDSIYEKRTGRCLDLCYLALHFLKNSLSLIQCPTTVELFIGVNFDHAILVLGLPPYIDRTNFTNWPEDTVILDPWLRNRFLLKDLPLYWRDVAYSRNWGNMQLWNEADIVMDLHATSEELTIMLTKLKPLFIYKNLLIPQRLQEQLKSLERLQLKMR